MAASVNEVAYELSRAGLDKQAQTLLNVRTRAGTLLAAAALVASFAGPSALRVHGSHLILAVLGLAGVLAVALLIMWPWTFVFRMEGSVVIDGERGLADEGSLDAVYEHLARTMDDHHDTNERKLKLMHDGFQAGCLCLAVEAIALLTAT